VKNLSSEVNVASRLRSEPSEEDWVFQAQSLQRVSRTFALTIPQLPTPLRDVVGNAYLLCRIADTIEDATSLSVEEKVQFSELFRRVIRGEEAPETFAATVAPRLEGGALEAEVALVQNAARVLRITQSFSATDRASLERCVRIMTEGMSHFQEGCFDSGLEDQSQLDKYCYYVAGVVGEMLTELFCAHSPAVAKNREVLESLAKSFGQGLQMTNILKDLWDDKGRNVCWLPRSIFATYDYDLRELSAHRLTPGFEKGLVHLIGVTRGHLENALRYALTIPKSEQGIRRFCLWAIGLAVLTLRKINANRRFSSGREVKVSRRTVYLTIFVTTLLGWNNTLLETAFRLAARGLPKPQGEPVTS